VRRLFSTPGHVARDTIGSPQSAKALVGSMADKRLKPHPHGFGICRSMAHGSRLLEELFVNVKRLFHTDDLAISFHPKQPDAHEKDSYVRVSLKPTAVNLLQGYN